MISYLCQIFVSQIPTFKDYLNAKKVIQIILEDYDHFKKNDLTKMPGFMDKKYYIEDDDKLERIRINLDCISKMSYNDIKKDELAYLLYPFVCGFRKLNYAYNNFKGVMSL